MFFYFLKFIIIFRLSMLDLVEDGMNFEEVTIFAKELEKSGVTILNTGIGWHEARIPTIATMVPRNAFTWISKRLKKEVSIPVITSNRINTFEKANQVITSKHADIVSMARPFLADADFVNKAAENKSDEINTCIGCNQACLDHVFKQKRASCLVNPMACYETELVIDKAKKVKKLAVIGAGPAGAVAALALTRAGKSVELVDSAKFPRSKPCAGWINTHAVKLLRELDKEALARILHNECAKYVKYYLINTANITK